MKNQLAWQPVAFEGELSFVMNPLVQAMSRDVFIIAGGVKLPGKKVRRAERETWVHILDLKKGAIVRQQDVIRSCPTIEPGIFAPERVS